jgi:hypothetical protein
MNTACLFTPASFTYVISKYEVIKHSNRYVRVFKEYKYHTDVHKHLFKFKVCKSVHHHLIQIRHQLDATISPVYYPDFYLKLNIFQASSRPSSGAQQLQ